MLLTHVILPLKYRIIWPCFNSITMLFIIHPKSHILRTITMDISSPIKYLSIHIRSPYHVPIHQHKHLLHSELIYQFPELSSFTIVPHTLTHQPTSALHNHVSIHFYTTHCTLSNRCIHMAPILVNLLPTSPGTDLIHRVLFWFFLLNS